MKFSVVIPLYNKEKSIPRTIESVLNQSYTHFEVVIVDDGSTDGSAAAVKKFTDNRIRLIQKNNGGVCSARNRGIQEAKYDYIALLDGDDYWDVNYLLEQKKMIEDFPEAWMWGINFAELDDGKIVRTLYTGLHTGYRGIVYNFFHIKNRVSDLFCSSSVVVRKQAFSEVGAFDERIKYSEDNDMWFRIIASYPVAFYDKYMVFYCFDAENRASKNNNRLKYSLEFYVDKFQKYKGTDFYNYIQKWSASKILSVYFNSEIERDDALIAMKKLDLSVIPLKYKLMIKLPYQLALLYKRIREILSKKLKGNDYSS